jgi:hypothetical protein
MLFFFLLNLDWFSLFTLAVYGSFTVAEVFSDKILSWYVFLLRFCISLIHEHYLDCPCIHIHTDCVVAGFPCIIMQSLLFLFGFSCLRTMYVTKIFNCAKFGFVYGLR